MHHEYAVQITQPLAVKRYLGAAGRWRNPETVAMKRSAPRSLPSRASHWGDSSNKLSWLIPDLAALFPQARFVHLVRDGRKVASSYFHKLGNENYDDRANAAMQDCYDGDGVAPPPEKPYWWPVPRRDDPLAADFRRFDQFQRIAWHWAEINRVAMDALADLRAGPNTVRPRWKTCGNLRLRCASCTSSWTCRLPTAMPRVFARPHNVNRPEDRLLTDIQRAQFDQIAGSMLERLGYAGRVEYLVNY